MSTSETKQLMIAASSTKPSISLDSKQRSRLGKFDSCQKHLKDYYEKLTELCAPMPKPGKSDWLSEHLEAGQTFDDFNRKAHTRVSPHMKTIYIQPLEEAIDQEMLQVFKAFLSAYFLGMEVKVLPYWLVEGNNKIASRINSDTGKKQYNAADILKAIQSKLPKDGYCIIACSMTDLYPRPTWNYGKRNNLSW